MRSLRGMGAEGGAQTKTRQYSSPTPSGRRGWRANQNTSIFISDPFHDRRRARDADGTGLADVSLEAQRSTGGKCRQLIKGVESSGSDCGGTSGRGEEGGTGAVSRLIEAMDELLQDAAV
jgi:hypothetical protein